MEGTYDAPTVADTFELTTSESMPAAQAHDLGSNLRNRLHGLAPNRVLIRRADYYPIARNQEAPRLRLIAEGALAGAAKELIADTILVVGKDAAARTPLTKDELDERADALSTGAETQAVAAALAALA